MQDWLRCHHITGLPLLWLLPYDQPGITTNHDVGMAVACKHLKHMSIFFAARSLEAVADRCQGQENPFELFAGMMREKYQLDGILEAKKLEVLRVHAYGSQYAMAGLSHLLHWFADESARLGRKTVIKVV